MPPICLSLSKLRDLLFGHEKHISSSAIVIITDLFKAFDSVHLPYLHFVFRSLGFERQFLNMLVTLNLSRKTRIKVFSYLLAPIQIQCGVHDASFIFSLAISALIHRLHNNVYGFRIRSSNFRTQAFMLMTRIINISFSL